MKRQYAHSMKATQSEVAMRTFAALGSTGKNFSPTVRDQRESATFASSINGDRVPETKIPTEKILLPAPPSKTKQRIFAS